MEKINYLCLSTRSPKTRDFFLKIKKKKKEKERKEGKNLR